MNTIVVGYDGTPPSERALDRGAVLAGALGAELVVVSVARVMSAAGRSAGPVDPTDTIEMHRDQLQAARDTLAARDVNASFVEGVGEPAAVILSAADERDAQLIVVGTREPTMIERLLGQSVSAAVSRHSHRDVMIVHDSHHG